MFAGTQESLGYAQGTFANSGWIYKGNIVLGNLMAESVAPTDSNGSPQIFTPVYGDIAGYADIAGTNLMIDTSFGGTNSCWIAYNAGTGLIYLANDAATMFITSSTVNPGTGGTVSNTNALSAMAERLRTQATTCTCP